MKTIRVHAKEWFDKANGNSYFSARIYIDDKQVAVLPFQYGYGDHYVDMANRYLIDNEIIGGWFNEHKGGANLPLWRYCNDNNIHLFSTKEEGCLKRELDK